MDATRTFLQGLGLPPGDLHDLPTSPSASLTARNIGSRSPASKGRMLCPLYLDEARARGVRIHRVSQGSGVMLLNRLRDPRDGRIGAEAQIEVSLFVGPRAAWEPGAQILSPAGPEPGRAQPRDGAASLRD